VADVIIAALLALDQAVATILGSFLAITPPKPEHKRKWRLAFVATGLIGVLLTGVLAYRGYASSQELVRLLRAEPKVITTTAIVSFGSLYDGTCADTTVPLTGVATRDAVKIGWPNQLPKGLYGDSFIPSGGIVDVRLCNLSGGTATLNAVPVRISVVR
jgi:hypothetical protein